MLALVVGLITALPMIPKEKKNIRDWHKGAYKMRHSQEERKRCSKAVSAFSIGLQSRLQVMRPNYKLDTPTPFSTTTYVQQRRKETQQYAMIVNTDLTVTK